MGSCGSILLRAHEVARTQRWLAARHDVADARAAYGPAHLDMTLIAERGRLAAAVALRYVRPAAGRT